MSARKEREWEEKRAKQQARSPLQHALVTDEEPSKPSTSRGLAYPLKTLRQKNNRDLQLLVDKKLPGHEQAAQVLHERRQLLARHQARTQQIPV